MRPTFRRAAIVALVVASLAPALIQGRTFNASAQVVSAEVGHGGSLFSMVWSLLADVLAGRVPGSGLAGSPVMAKDTVDNGGHMDPNGTTMTAPPAPPVDNGGHLDPNG
ncbi:MAG TPA: hypothetical protein VGS07_34505 [Thermoanaerobaculia bacterium]|jgi:hypothetical protein|nr:hypothetical protein [Thermoanaerobaculia bacterium]